jgi:hypothetical protein
MILRCANKLCNFMSIGICAASRACSAFMHRTVSDWVKAHVESLPETPMPAEVKTAEMDELFTFIGNKNDHR